MEKLDLSNRLLRWEFVHWLTTMEAMSPHQANLMKLTPQSGRGDNSGRCFGAQRHAKILSPTQLDIAVYMMTALWPRRHFKTEH
jgi:hypothetical protein